MSAEDAGPDASRGPAGSTGGAAILPFRRRSRYAQFSRIAELNAAYAIFAPITKLNMLENYWVRKLVPMAALAPTEVAP